MSYHHRMTTDYPDEWFRRVDEESDPEFYSMARLVVHIDDGAIWAITEYLRGVLQKNGTVLDIMSSWRSHLPHDVQLSKVVGIGLNEEEMGENPQLDEAIVHDLNAEPTLPFPDCVFDTAIISVSVQYITRPVALFKEAGRVLKGGGSLHVFYSNRMFPTKAVAIWKVLDERQRAGLVESYFRNSAEWRQVQSIDINPPAPLGSDPMFVVAGYKGVEECD